MRRLALLLSPDVGQDDYTGSVEYHETSKEANRPKKWVCRLEHYPDGIKGYGEEMTVKDERSTQHTTQNTQLAILISGWDRIGHLPREKSNGMVDANTLHLEVGKAALLENL